MKQIREGIYFIQGQDEFIPDSHVYIIGKPNSADLTMIDAGLMGKGKYKVDAMNTLGIDPRNIKRVIMTHTHLDHLGCLSEILKALDNVEIWMHAREADPLEAGDERIAYGMEMFKSMCQAQYGVKDGAFSLSVDRKLEGGETLQIGGMAWEVIHIPGHSPGSIGLYHREEKVLIPGDVVYADYAIGRFDLHGANGREHADSLFALSELEVDVLLPGHNRIVEKVAPGYILKTGKQWEPYLT